LVKTGNRQRNLIAGFTLLELLIVLAIAGILVSLIPSIISAAIPGTKLKVASREIAATLRDSRSKAVSAGKVFDVTINFDPPQYVVGGNQPHNFPDGVNVIVRNNTDIDSYAASPDQYRRSDDGFKIRFYPDGGSSGAIITLKQDKLAYIVTVEWLLGGVSISRSAADVS